MPLMKASLTLEDRFWSATTAEMRRPSSNAFSVKESMLKMAWSGIVHQDQSHRTVQKEHDEHRRYISEGQRHW